MSMAIIVLGLASGALIVTHLLPFYFDRENLAVGQTLIKDMNDQLIQIFEQDQNFSGVPDIFSPNYTRTHKFIGTTFENLLTQKSIQFDPEKQEVITED